MTVKESKLLQAISDNEGVVYAREVIGEDYTTVQLLRNRGYVIYQGALNMACYSITDEGRIALQDHYTEQKHRRTESIRYWITTAIAIAALIISIIALRSKG